MPVCNVVGARPNFMKMAPLILELEHRRIPQILVHTGQHYEDNLSDVFIRELGMPEPDIRLIDMPNVNGFGIARMMVRFEELCQKYRPSLVVVAGDVKSTLAASLVASKLGIDVAHIESGLRSFDCTMPEEINRIVTDHLSELLFTTEESGNQNLRREGIPEKSIHFVGNSMVDTLLRHRDEAERGSPWIRFGLEPGTYGLVTLHRPSNVDHPDILGSLMKTLCEVSQKIPLIFPVHPRTRRQLQRLTLPLSSRLQLCQPLPYLTFLGLMARSRLVLTDSGGIQEETTALKIPCLTLRPNTERPVTVTNGTNQIVGTDPAKIRQAVDKTLEGAYSLNSFPPLWDGKAASRIVDHIEAWLNCRQLQETSKPNG